MFIIHVGIGTCICLPATFRLMAAIGAISHASARQLLVHIAASTPLMVRTCHGQGEGGVPNGQDMSRTVGGGRTYGQDMSRTGGGGRTYRSP